MLCATTCFCLVVGHFFGIAKTATAIAWITREIISMGPCIYYECPLLAFHTFNSINVRNTKFVAPAHSLCLRTMYIALMWFTVWRSQGHNEETVTSHCVKCENGSNQRNYYYLARTSLAECCWFIQFRCIFSFSAIYLWTKAQGLGHAPWTFDVSVLSTRTLKNIDLKFF